MACRWSGSGGMHVEPEVERVYGPDLMLEVFAATQTVAFRHFFYGGAPGVAEELKAKLEARFPGASDLRHLLARRFAR